MKRTGKLFALLAAIVMALVLVPRLAWAANADLGDLETSGSNTGTITIANPKSGETYTVYKIFDLASFTDKNPATGQHDVDSEAYSYVIKTDSPWLDFLEHYNKNGAVTGSAVPYAIRTNDSNYQTKVASAYFSIDSEPISLKQSGDSQASEYYIVHPTGLFSNAWDLPDSTSARGELAAGENAPVADDDIMSNGSKHYGVVQSFAQEAVKYAMNHASGTGAITVVAKLDGDVTNGNNENTAWKTTQPLGYYLVGTTMGTLAALDTNNKDVSVYEKNDEPAIEKKVLKKGSTVTIGGSEDLVGKSTGSDAVWVENIDADINDYVMFRTVITAQQGAKNYVLHDVMEQGLTFISSEPSNLTTSTSPDRYSGVTSYLPKVYLVRGNTIYNVPSTINFDNADRTNYSLSTSSLKDSDCDFEIVFNDADESDYGNDYVRFAVTSFDSNSTQWIDIQDGDKIVVTYWAQVNTNARLWGDTGKDETKTGIKYHDASVIDENGQIAKDDGNERNTNSTILTYGDKSRTAWDRADVTVYRFDIVKTKPENADNAGNGVFPMLTGAQFSLYKTVSRSEAVDDFSADYASESLKSGYARFTPNGATAGATTDVYYRTSKMRFSKDANGYTYKYNGDSDSSGETTLQSDGTNEINVQGLEAWGYVLIEDKAPTGYNKLANPIVVTIRGDVDCNGTGTNSSLDDYEGTITTTISPNSGAASTSENNHSWKATVENSTYTKGGNGGVHIINQSGQELPSTGGLGTKAFYAIGGSLFAASVIFLLTKKRLMQAA